MTYNSWIFNHDGVQAGLYVAIAHTFLIGNQRQPGSTLIRYQVPPPCGIQAPLGIFRLLCSIMRKFDFNWVDPRMEHSSQVQILPIQLAVQVFAMWVIANSLPLIAQARLAQKDCLPC